MQPKVQTKSAWRKRLGSEASASCALPPIHKDTSANSMKRKSTTNACWRLNRSTSGSLRWFATRAITSAITQCQLSHALSNGKGTNANANASAVGCSKPTKQTVDASGSRYGNAAKHRVSRRKSMFGTGRLCSSFCSDSIFSCASLNFRLIALSPFCTYSSASPSLSGSNSWKDSRPSFPKPCKSRTLAASRVLTPCPRNFAKFSDPTPFCPLLSSTSSLKVSRLCCSCLKDFCCLSSVSS
mmetsp:Transcript_69442/g.122838  ORF Transcript_69442/g.122838 Transcript_69442/m.122838 type:complete len:241 (+) Transcript_69442:163-885(+)